MSSGKVLIGVVAGLAAGVALGILFAPNKGSKTRKLIRRKGEDYVEEFKEKFDDALQNITDSVKKTSDELVEQAKLKISGSKN